MKSIVSKRILMVLMSVCTFMVGMCSFSLQVSPAKADSAIHILACTDYQPSGGTLMGENLVNGILDSVKSDGVESVDAFFCCGDYDKDTYGNATKTREGVDSLKSVVSPLLGDGQKVFVQGNHDPSGVAGLSASGKNDPVSGDYGVFVINHDDYMWQVQDKTTVQETAQALVEYCNEKLQKNFTRPIFVLSHLPLHYNMRTETQGDGMYANYLFDVLNEAGEKGLNIFFLFGHNHSNGWDDYLGGGAVYLAKGDEILIAQGSRNTFSAEKLNFTYLNAGYVGYYGAVNEGSDSATTMTLFTIENDCVTVKRYDKNGLHSLKSVGVKNEYKNETRYEPVTAVYDSPQTVMLTSISNQTPIADVIVKVPVTDPMDSDSSSSNSDISSQENEGGCNATVSGLTTGLMLIIYLCVGGLLFSKRAYKK